MADGATSTIVSSKSVGDKDSKGVVEFGAGDGIANDLVDSLSLFRRVMRGTMIATVTARTRKAAETSFTVRVVATILPVSLLGLFSCPVRY